MNYDFPFQNVKEDTMYLKIWPTTSRSWKKTNLKSSKLSFWPYIKCHFKLFRLIFFQQQLTDRVIKKVTKFSDFRYFEFSRFCNKSLDVFFLINCKEIPSILKKLTNTFKLTHRNEEKIEISCLRVEEFHTPHTLSLYIFYLWQ